MRFYFLSEDVEVLLRWNPQINFHIFFLNFKLRILSLTNSQGHIICKLRYITLVEVKIVPFQQWFQSETTENDTYLGYFWNYLGQGQNCNLKNIT